VDEQKRGSQKKLGWGIERGNWQGRTKFNVGDANGGRVGPQKKKRFKAKKRGLSSQYFQVSVTKGKKKGKNKLWGKGEGGSSRGIGEMERLIVGK